MLRGHDGAELSWRQYTKSPVIYWFEYKSGTGEKLLSVAKKYLNNKRPKNVRRKMMSAFF